MRFTVLHCTATATTTRLLFCESRAIQRAYLTREQCDAAVEFMRTGDAAAMGLWVAFEGRGFGDFLSFLQPLQVMFHWLWEGEGGGGGMQFWGK